jgi:pimeloyl-ACP methyl ester carboxylesterase
VVISIPENKLNFEFGFAMEKTPQANETSLLPSGPLAFSFLEGSGKTLVISIAGVGTKRHVQPPPEFFKLASQGGAHNVLFISDASRSWLNGPGIAASIVEQIEFYSTKIDATRIVIIGNSMGGSMALALAGLTKVDAVLAIVPQYSAHPKMVPDEKRWLYFRRKINDWPYKAIDKLPTDICQTVILHGGTDDELIHLRRFPKDNKAWHYVFPEHGHRLAAQLHANGLLSAIVKHLIQGQPRKLRKAIRRANGITRAEFDLSNPHDTLADSQLERVTDKTTFPEPSSLD